MNFVEKLLDLITQGFNKMIDSFMILFEWLGKILGYLVEFLVGIFYFIWKLFEIVVEILQIFVACFQFVFALGSGVFRTIKMWIGVTPSGALNFPSVSNTGFGVVIDVASGTGLLTVVPMVALAFLWFYFVLKIIGLFGGNVMINYKSGD